MQNMRAKTDADIAAEVWRRWDVIVTAVDNTHGQGEEREYRHAVVAKAVRDAGLVLTTRETIAAYHRCIAELRRELRSRVERRERLEP